MNNSLKNTNLLVDLFILKYINIHTYATENKKKTAVYSISSSDADSGGGHGFSTNVSLPLIYSEPAVSYNTSRLWWPSVLWHICIGSV